MSEDVEISVILSVYNIEGSFKESIDSILQQTCSNVELIIVNNVSTADINFIIHSYADKRIILLNQEQHKGCYGSRNRGIFGARGKYIVIMDADDIAMPNRFEKQVVYLEDHPDVLAVGTDYISKKNYKQKKTVCSYPDILITLLEYNCLAHSSLMIRADVLRQLKGYDEHCLYSADYDLACRLALKGRIENLAEPLILHCGSLLQYSKYEKEIQKLHIDEIRCKYQMSFVSRFAVESQSIIEDADVSYPDMGRLICLYTYASNTSDSKYEQMADMLLDKIFEDVSLEMPVCLKNGLLGIGCGLIYLIRNHFVKGEEDDVLSEIDSCLFNALICMEDETEVDWYGWLHYFRLRILYDHPIHLKICEITIHQYAVYLLDCLMRGLQKEMAWDNRIIRELELFHQIKLCPTKTEHILSFLSSINNDNISFVIPIRVDSIERERNLDIVLEQLCDIENANIYILEGDTQPLYKLKKEYSNVKYNFVEDSNPVFYRTKYLNQLLRDAHGAIVGIWDTDIVLPKEQIIDAVKAIRSGRAIMSFPYDGHFYMLSPDDSDRFAKNCTFERSDELVKKSHLAHGPHSVGGAFFVNRKIYLQYGGENEHFYGWGPEDAERVKRMEILGLQVYRAKGPLFHLFHPRMDNSWYGSEEIELKNRMEFLNVCNKTCDELQKYIETWEWLPGKICQSI